MTKSSAPGQGILKLPNELLFELLKLSLPGDFEALILTCKLFYLIGKPLIGLHKFCKSWMNHHFKDPHTQQITISDPVRFLLCLSKVPAQFQTTVLSYFQNISWWGLLEPFMVEDDLQVVLDEVFAKASWLQKLFTRIEDHLSGYPFPRSTSYPDWIDTSSSIPPPLDSVPFKTGYLLALCTAATLLLFPSIEYITFEKYPCYRKHNGDPIIPATIAYCRGEIYFQQLREINLKNVFNNTIANLAPLLLLPRLKSLIVAALDNYDPPQDNKNSLSYKWPYGERKSVLEKLVLFNADADPNEFANFLEPIPSLRSLVWENNTQFGKDYSEDENEDANESENENGDENEDLKNKEDIEDLPKVNDSVYPESAIVPNTTSHHPASFLETIPERISSYSNYMDACRNITQLESDSIDLRGDYDTTYDTPGVQFISQPMLDYDDISDFEESDLEIDAELKESGFKPGELRLWEPIKLVDQLIQKYQYTLEHLALTITMNYEYSLIERKHQIVDFKSFCVLRYLEFDLRITRPLRGLHKESTSIPRSLKQLLPGSIEVVRVVVFYPKLEKLWAMLQSLPYNLDQLPKLRKIILIMRGYFSSSDQDSINMEIINQLEPLQAKLERLGVIVQFESLRFSIGYPRPQVDLR
jgi:hypothetical protein